MQLFTQRWFNEGFNAIYIIENVMHHFNAMIYAKKWCKCIITEVFINNSMQRFMQNGCVKDSMPQIFTKNKKNVFTNGSIQQFT